MVPCGRVEFSGWRVLVVCYMSNRASVVMDDHFRGRGHHPSCLQIRDQIVLGMARGDLPEGTALPSIRRLAQDLHINLHTVNKSCDLLRRARLVQLTKRDGAQMHITAKPDEAFRQDFEERFGTLSAEAYGKGLIMEEMLNAGRRILDGFAPRGRGCGNR